MVVYPQNILKHLNFPYTLLPEVQFAPPTRRLLTPFPFALVILNMWVYFLGCNSR